MLVDQKQFGRNKKDQFQVLTALGTQELVGIKRDSADNKYSLDNIRALASYKRVQTEAVFDKPINGYGLMTMPSPNPSTWIKLLSSLIFPLDAEKSPLITWGEVEMTPMRIETEKRIYKVSSLFRPDLACLSSPS